MNANRDLKTERKLFELKTRLVNQFMSKENDPNLYLPIQAVASDALEQASLSPLPLIVYPILFEAKSEAVLESNRLKTKCQKEHLTLSS